MHPSDERTVRDAPAFYCLLQLLASHPLPGADIASRLRRAGVLTEHTGPVYAVLLRLRALGLVRPAGLPDGTRGYALTDDGRHTLEAFTRVWGASRLISADLVFLG
ncbi:PadR family transcriptional regulator [Streptomyces solincola]|uniref:PadR family transcriptional regulator n=2 Tax=Streptomyces solincola TaxID=2100817 RepID=A0A2S9Q2G2_9ACTN|nr:PadR family transcriptional regulator [Streptomyces solincola]